MLIRLRELREKNDGPPAAPLLEGLLNRVTAVEMDASETKLKGAPTDTMYEVDVLPSADPFFAADAAAPSDDLAAVAAMLGAADWTKQFVAIDGLRRLVLRHRDDAAVAAGLDALLEPLCARAHELRSTVSRNALFCLGDIFSTCGGTAFPHARLAVTTCIDMSGSSAKVCTLLLLLPRINRGRRLRYWSFSYHRLTARLSSSFRRRPSTPSTPSPPTARPRSPSPPPPASQPRPTATASCTPCSAWTGSSSGSELAPGARARPTAARRSVSGPCDYAPPPSPPPPPLMPLALTQELDEAALTALIVPLSKGLRSKAAGSKTACKGACTKLKLHFGEKTLESKTRKVPLSRRPVRPSHPSPPLGPRHRQGGGDRHLPRGRLWRGPGEEDVPQVQAPDEEALLGLAPGHAQAALPAAVQVGGLGQQAAGARGCQGRPQAQDVGRQARCQACGGGEGGGGRGGGA